MGERLAFERLKGLENFVTWRVGARAHLITKGHWKQFSLDVAALTEEPDREKNMKALAELTLLLDPCVYTYIEECKTAKEAWNALMKSFEDSGVVRKVSLLKQWISLKYSECESMQDYVNQCLILRSKVKSAGFKIEEDVAGSIILCGLPEEFKPLVMSIETKSSDLTVDFVKNTLLQETNFKSDNETALAIKTRKFANRKKYKRQ